MTGPHATAVPGHDREPGPGTEAPREAHEVVHSMLQEARTLLSAVYRDIDLIGMGANGIVVSARPTDGREPEALKIDFGEVHDALAHERFEAECAVGQLLSHRFIVPVSRKQAVGSLSWFAMPYVGKGRLDLLLRFGPPPRPHALGILRSLASALDYAHAMGVVHGALRPSKVHLLPHGQCMLSGFMLRRGQPGHPALSPSVIGDPAYMAPEQRADGHGIDGRADQYALAVIAAELLLGTHRVQHGKSGVAEVIPISMNGTPANRDGKSNGADIEAIRRAFLPDPTLRFPTTTAFVEALTATPVFNDHGHEEPLPPPRWHRTLVRRLLLLVVVLMAALLGPTIGRQALSRVMDVAQGVLVPH